MEDQGSPLTGDKGKAGGLENHSDGTGLEDLNGAKGSEDRSGVGDSEG